MANIIINERSKTLEITKKFASMASRFGSDEYMELKAARSEFPTFKVVTKTTSRKSKDSFKGLTYEFMENYIKSRSNSEIIIKEYNQMREIGKSVAAVKAYAQIKKGFFVRQTRFDLDDIRILAECVYSAKFISRGQAERLVDVITEFVSVHQADKIKQNSFLTDRVKTNNKQVLNNISRINEAISTKRHTPEQISFRQ